MWRDITPSLVNLKLMSTDVIVWVLGTNYRALTSHLLHIRAENTSKVLCEALDHLRTPDSALSQVWIVYLMCAAVLSPADC